MSLKHTFNSLHKQFNFFFHLDFVVPVISFQNKQKLTVYDRFGTHQNVINLIQTTEHTESVEPFLFSIDLVESDNS